MRIADLDFKIHKRKVYNFIFLCLLVVVFFACKRSIHQQTQREYDTRLVAALQKLAQKYADKKVRINTWDKKADAYQDFMIVNDEEQLTETLTIGDSVQFIAIDLSQPDGIRAEIKSQNDKTGYIPYFKIEEFEPAVLIDPDLKD